MQWRQMAALIRYFFQVDPYTLDEEQFVILYRDAQFILNNIYKPHVPIPY